jgi:2-polyprenyl-6-methoxyphenol hydroxylase-like FAD-dependent oxidoreductase
MNWVVGSSDRPRVLVVGAGPTGLTAAVELARRGTLPEVIDSGDGPTPLSKAVGISPHSLDLLEPSGITPMLLAQGIRIEQALVHRRGGVLGRIDLTRLRHRYAFLLALPQSVTETLMAQALRAHGGDVQWRTRLESLEGRHDKVAVVLEGADGRREVEFDLVYGADGAHSTVREAAGIAFPGREHQRRWSIADAEVEDWPYAERAAHLFLHDAGDVGFVIPIGERRFRAVSNTVDALARVPGDYRVTRRLREDVFTIPVRHAARYQAGNVFLGGDAAHVQSPVGGRGMNLGIEDAVCFADRLQSQSLAAYQTERRPVGARWIALSERVLSGVQSTDALTRAARDLAIRIVGRIPPLQRPLLERIAGLRE